MYSIIAQSRYNGSERILGTEIYYSPEVLRNYARFSLRSTERIIVRNSLGNRVF